MTVGMEGDRHFSHPHPLTSFLDDVEVDVTDNFHSCKICGLPILSAPSYTCTIAACEFFLNESCVQKIQQEFIYSGHFCQRLVDSGEHTQRLREGSQHFTYKCEDCSFQMHPLTAVDGVEIKTKHKSHPPHVFVALYRETLSLCDVCGVKHDGFFFSCQQCNFWIHQDCTILPTALKLLSNPWPFLLAYSIHANSRYSECIICEEPLLLSRNAIYLCPQTLEFSHVRCGLDKIQSSTPELYITHSLDFIY